MSNDDWEIRIKPAKGGIGCEVRVGNSSMKTTAVGIKSALEDAEAAHTHLMSRKAGAAGNGGPSVPPTPSPSPTS